jgi:hypothetical protein
MSEFLAPIHWWLYKKIRLVMEREQLIYEKAQGVCGSAAEELRAQVWQTYGEALPDADLEQLIDHDNIHGWLQRQINLAESREAAFIKELLDICDQAACEIVGEAFYEHGLHCGNSAKLQHTYDVSTADGIYKALNDYYLNGMPCDQEDVLVENTAQKVIWENSAWLQESNWKRTGVDCRIMKSFYQRWWAGFVAGANSIFSFRQTKDIIKGDGVNRYEIIHH